MKEQLHWYDEVIKERVVDMYLPSSYSPSNECIELLTHFEGFSDTAYLDQIAKPNIWTIGHGFTKNVKEGDTITYEESVSRKLVEINEHWDGIESAIHIPITQGICDALSSWAYNVGVGAARRSTLIRKLNQGEYEQAADELLRWNKAGVKVVNGLTRRRKAEREMFLGRDWRKYYV